MWWEVLNRMLRKIRSLVSNSNYFGIYDNALSKKECEILINQFEKSPQLRGMTYLDDNPEPQVRNDIKSSIELKGGSKFSDRSVISNIIRPQLIKCMVKYNAAHPQLTPIHTWDYFDDYNFQKYENEDDGYKTWHCEHGSGVIGDRIMAWMFYLNNAKSGTEFMNYPTVRAKMGRCVIWPAFWTHIHRGAPNKGLKYIITGWISYQ